MPPIVAGHRGAAGLAPENTIPSFRKAVEIGVRLLELDVRGTRDGVLVCFHDDRLDRVTPERGPVSEWDWERLREVPVLPGAFGGAFPDARIPLLESVLAALPPDCSFLVELKPDPAGEEPLSSASPVSRHEHLVRRTLEVLRSAAPGRARIISFEDELLRRVGELARDEAPPIGVLAGPRGDGTLLERARALRAEAVHPHHSTVSPDLLRAARDEGFRLNAWTVNNAEEVRRLAALGLDEITTDYPDMALRAL